MYPKTLSYPIWLLDIESGLSDPQGGTLIFSYIRRLASFLGGSKLKNIYILGLFSENEYFWGHDDFVDIFWRSSQNWTIFRDHFYAF